MKPNDVSNLSIIYFIQFLNYILSPDKIKRDESLEKILAMFEDDDIFIEYCYFYRKIIHKILYEKEEYIIIKQKKYKLSFYIYLVKLIESDNNNINYSYQYEFIKDLNNDNDNEQSIIRKIIYSKIIITLIMNYINNDNNTDTEVENELIKIKNDCVENIKNNINKKEIDLNILNENIEDISINIIYFNYIKYLIKKIKEEKYDEANEIINELDLENVFIIDSIIVELSDYLKEPQILNDYKIEKIEDLFNTKNINFYYILLKYIFKKTYFIADIPFLMDLRKTIIRAVKQGADNLFTNLDGNELQEKKEYILKRILDCDFYYNKYKDIRNEKLSIYNKSFNSQPKKDDIKNNEEIKNKNNKNISLRKNIEPTENKKQETSQIHYSGDNNKDSLNNNIKTDNQMNSVKLTQDETTQNKNTQKPNYDEMCIKIKNIFDKSSYTINYNKKKKDSISLENIVIGKNNEKLGHHNYKDIKTYLEINDNIEVQKIKNKNNMSKSLAKLEEFINEVANEIKLDHESEFTIVLHFENLEDNYEEKFDFDNIPNIYCRYEVSFAKINLKLSFKENNILKYKTKSDSLGFDTMVFEINDNINRILNFKNNFKDWDELEKRIKDKKIQNITLENKEKLLESFKDENNKELLLNIFDQDRIDYFIAENTKFFQKQKCKEILKYYNDYFPESKKNDIKLIEQILEQNEEIDEKYLIDYECIKKMNLRRPMIEYLIKKCNMLNHQKEIEKIVNKWNNIEKIINNKAIRDSTDIVEDIFEFFIKKENKECLLKVFSKEIYDYSMEEIKSIKSQTNSNNLNNENNYFENNINDTQNSNATIRSRTAQYDTQISNASTRSRTTQYNTNIIKSEINQNQIFYINRNDTSNSVISDESTKGKTSEIKNKRKNVFGINQNEIIHEKSETTEVEKLMEEIMRHSYYIINYNVKKKDSFSVSFEDLVVGKTKMKIGSKYYKIMEYIENNQDEDISKIFNQLIEFLNEVVDEIKHKFIFNYNLIIKLELENGNNDDISNINCKYIFCPPNFEEQSFLESNILKYKTKSKLLGFDSMFEEIKRFNNNIINNELIKDGNECVSVTGSTQKKSTIIEHKKIIGIHQDKKSVVSAEFIIELSNHFYMSGGTDNKLKLYDKDFKEKREVLIDIKEWTYNICEKIYNEGDKNKKDNLIEIITCSNKEMIVISLNFKNEHLEAQSQKYELPSMTCVNCVQINNNNYVIIGLYNAYYFTDLFDSEKSTHMAIINKVTYRDAIKINDDIIAMTSNKVGIEGEDNLILYSISSKSKKKYSERGGKTFSFTYKTNCLAVMGRVEKKQILLCGCKKYFPEQENGILLFNPILEFKGEREGGFCETKNFEVYCFCPIFEEDKNNKYEKETDYFLVGGFDNDKEEGSIKIFKLLYDKTDIEFIQDIEFLKNTDFDGFKGPISSLIQSKLLGNILATCYDGKVHLLSKVDLDLLITN